MPFPNSNVEKQRAPKHPPNRVVKQTEDKILALCLEHPAWGAQRIANARRLMDVNVSTTGVRGVWTRHGLPRRSQRLLRLEGEANKETIALSAEQIRMLEKHSPEFRVCNIEANAPGEMLNQDTFRWGRGRSSQHWLSRFGQRACQVARSSGAGSDRSLSAHPGEPLHTMPGAFA